LQSPSTTGCTSASRPAKTTDDFAKSFNNGMHKCIAAGKDAATRVAKFLKQKINETQAVADG